MLSFKDWVKVTFLNYLKGPLNRDIITYNSGNNTDKYDANNDNNNNYNDSS